MDVDPDYNYIQKFRGGVQWYVMESKDIISSICFKIRNENNQLVSFSGQSITYHFSIINQKNSEFQLINACNINKAKTTF